MPKPPKHTKPTKTKVMAWLKAHGHQASKVDTKAMNNDAEIKQSLWELHGVKLP